VAVTAAAWIAGCSLVAFPFDEYDKLTGVDASGSRDGATPTPPDGDASGAQPDSGGAATCTANVQSDPKNCGACGHDCLGQPCSNGLCSPETVYHDATGQVHAMAIAVDPADPTYLFVGARGASNGSILRVAKAPTGGGAAGTLATGIFATYGMVVAGGTVFWTQGDGVPAGSRGIGQVQKTPGGTAQLAAVTGEPDWIAADATSLFWDAYDQNGLWSAAQSAPGKSQEILTSDIHGFAVDDTRVFVSIADSSGTGTISTAAKDGTGPGTITAESFPGDISLDGDYVYWATVPHAPNGAIRRAPKTGGSVTEIAGAQNRPCCVDVAGPFVYWITLATDTRPAAIMRAPIAGGAPLTLATVSDEAFSTHHDASYVYWVDDGDVLRVAR
jgi:hypothetical protein